MFSTKLLLPFVASASVLRNPINIDLTVGKQPELHMPHEFDQNSWTAHLSEKLTNARVNVEGWDSELVNVEIEKKAGFYVVVARYLNTDYAEQRLTQGEEYDEDENDFIIIKFDENQPGVADLTDLNLNTGLTPRELEQVTQTQASSWMLFVQKLAFEVMSCNKITLHDFAKVVVRAKEPMGMMETYLREMDPRVINLACGKDYFSPYQKYGFIPMENDWDERKYATVLHFAKQVLPTPEENLRVFKQFQMDIADQQDGDVFAGTDAAEREFEYVNQLESILNKNKILTPLPSRFQLPYHIYAGIQSISPHIPMPCGEPIISNDLERVASLGSQVSIEA